MELTEHITVVTPENVEVAYEPAGVGTRFVAVLLDHTLQALIIVAGISLTGFVVAGAGALGRIVSGAVSPVAVAASILWAFLVFWGYFAFFEIVWGGSTPGKRAMGIRVIREGGFPVDPFAAIVRNLVRAADLLPPIYGAGLICMLASPGARRLGDWAAGTIVIKARIRRLPAMVIAAPPSERVAAYMSQMPASPDLSSEEYSVLRRFVERRNTLPIAVQVHLAIQLAARLRHAMGDIDPPEIQIEYTDMLEALLRRYLLARQPGQRPSRS